MTQYSEFDVNRTPLRCINQEDEVILGSKSKFKKSPNSPAIVIKSDGEVKSTPKKINDLSIPKALGNFSEDGKFI